jgi:hypothetical protein
VLGTHRLADLKCCDSKGITNRFSHAGKTSGDAWVPMLRQHVSSRSSRRLGGRAGGLLGVKLRFHACERVYESADAAKRFTQPAAPSSAAKTPQERSVLQRQIDATDRQIDQLVYELYGLTDAEIRIVEAANA